MPVKRNRKRKQPSASRDVNVQATLPYEKKIAKSPKATSYQQMRKLVELTAEEIVAQAQKKGVQVQAYPPVAPSMKPPKRRSQAFEWEARLMDNTPQLTEEMYERNSYTVLVPMTYTPDFSWQMDNGKMRHIEVKGYLRKADLQKVTALNRDPQHQCLLVFQEKPRVEAVRTDPMHYLLSRGVPVIYCPSGLLPSWVFNKDVDVLTSAIVEYTEYLMNTGEVV